MLATRNEATRRFAELVEFAQGDSFLVYQALFKLQNASDEKIKKYIEDSLKESSKKKSKAA